MSSAGAIFGRPYRQFLAAREVSCRRTLRWTPFSGCSLATSGRFAANNLLIYSSRTRYSRLLSACWSWRCNSAQEYAQNLAFHVGGANASLWLRLCWTFVLQNVGGSEWVRSLERLVLSGVRIAKTWGGAVSSEVTRWPAMRFEIVLLGCSVAPREARNG